MKAVNATANNQISKNTGDLAMRHRRLNASAKAGSVPRRHSRGLPAERRRSRQPSFSFADSMSAMVSGRRLKIGFALLVLVVVLVMMAASVLAYRAFARSALFTLHKVEVVGAVRAPQDEIEHLVRQQVMKDGLWLTELESIRKEVMKFQGVHEAEVRRVLPDTLRVTITEREPFALARRRNGAVVWVDRDGLALGERTKFKVNSIPPIISGLPEGNDDKTKEASREKLKVYEQLMTALDSEGTKLSENVDEIILDDLNDLEIRLLKKRIRVQLGEANYRSRLEAALNVLEAVERCDLNALTLLKVSDAERLLANAGRISYLNATQEDRVIVGLMP
jgi:cell division septal protein FtsQ